MDKFQTLDSRLLNRLGLNRLAVFNIAALPSDIIQSIRNNCAGEYSAYRQLILIGHAGQTLWGNVKKSGMDSENPIDDFSIRVLKEWFDACQPRNIYEILYPGTQPIGLQRLGQLAGWHHASPLRIGIDREWGTWYAYRAVVLADTGFEPTRPLEGDSPCDDCAHRVCISSCPGKALESGALDIGKCIGYRKGADSQCKATCVARVSCPVGSVHRYCHEQIRHTYSMSLRAIEGFMDARPGSRPTRNSGDGQF